MKFSRIAFFFACAMIFLAARADAQKSLSFSLQISDADIINATALVDPLAEKVKDIAPGNFSMMIINNTGKDVSANMSVQAFVTLDEDRARTQFVNSKTRRPFLIPPAGRLFTSRDADSPDFNFMNLGDLTAARDRLKNKVTDPGSGGKVPSGIYEVKIQFTVEQIGSSPASELIEVNDPRLTLTVTNPTTATLLLPSENGFEYPSPFPQFQWMYDTRAVVLTIYEKRPEHQSLEDAISASDPYLKVQIDRRESGNLSILTYPQSATSGPGVTILKGPRPLEPGKVYVAVLDGIIKTFGYEVDPLRMIRSFRISDPTGQMILNVLQAALSGGSYQNILNVVQDQKLQVNGARISLNGVQITAQELQVLLTQNKSKIKSITFED